MNIITFINSTMGQRSPGAVLTAVGSMATVSLWHTPGSELIQRNGQLKCFLPDGVSSARLKLQQRSRIKLLYVIIR